MFVFLIENVLTLNDLFSNVFEVRLFVGFSNFKCLNAYMVLLYFNPALYLGFAPYTTNECLRIRK